MGEEKKQTAFLVSFCTDLDILIHDTLANLRKTDLAQPQTVDPFSSRCELLRREVRFSAFYGTFHTLSPKRSKEGRPRQGPQRLRATKEGRPQQLLGTKEVPSLEPGLVEAC